MGHAKSTTNNTRFIITNYMGKNDLVTRGSTTAKNGFKNEGTVIDKFNAWESDADAQEWLTTMHYKLEEIERVAAIKVPGHPKTDVQVQVKIYLKKIVSAENISIKLVSNPQGFNQIDKRWVDNYVDLWNIPTNIVKALKLFTGEIQPTRTLELKDSRRMFFTEMTEEVQKSVLEFFKANKIMIVSDILKGRDRFAAEWFLVALKTKGLWSLKSINEVLNIFGNGDVVISKQGSLRIGKIGMQRKGGDGGRPSANMLQFKINPVIVFDPNGTGVIPE